MKLATFELNGNEHFGFLLAMPDTGEEWLVEPDKAASSITAYAQAKTSGYQFSLPDFGGLGSWPVTLKEFLCLGEKGLEALGKLVTFTGRLVEQGDGYQVLMDAGHKLSETRLLAPIPNPRLLWGIVGNFPGFTRNHLNIRHVNLLPQGHQRHPGSVVSPGEPFVYRRIPGQTGWGYNVELGVVIGKKCRNITPDEAMDFVAGYTVVCDTFHGYYNSRYPEIGKHNDRTSIMTYGWVHKNTDMSCSVGPYLVTKDEVGHPYDLMTYTRMNGILRDRANTCSMLVGVERTIAYYSSFGTLYPGDIIHMGSSGKDGVGINMNWDFGKEQPFVECEIEKLGVLRNPIRYTPYDSSEATRDLHMPAAAKRRALSGQMEVTAEEWNISGAGSFIIGYGNYRTCDSEEQMQPSNIPRYLWAVSAALGESGSEVRLSAEKEDLYIGAEIAFVIGKMGKWADGVEAEDMLLGYVPMISLHDGHLAEKVVEPSLPRERAMAEIYSRWEDGVNVAASHPVNCGDIRKAALPMRLYVDEDLAWTGNTADYICGVRDFVEIITFGSTLMPGDVITLGRVGALVKIPAGKRNGSPHAIRLEVESMPTVTCTVY